MKTLFVSIILIIIVSCSKKNDDTSVTKFEQLEGRWKWESTCGGFTVECMNSSELHYAEIEFTSDEKFIEKHNDTIFQQTNYSITKYNELSGKMILRNSNYQMPILIINNHLEINCGELINIYTKTK